MHKDNKNPYKKHFLPIFFQKNIYKSILSAKKRNKNNFPDNKTLVKNHIKPPTWHNRNKNAYNRLTTTANRWIYKQIYKTA